uniref:Uncharacterized protein n=1 Tax=Panagrolaimus superbus TaxID=310955 RepID=A0A914XTG3_9BILA
MKPGNGGAEEKCSHEIFATNIDPKFGVASFEPSTPAIRSESHTCVSLISDNCMAFASGYSSSVASSPRRANFEKDNDGDDDEIDVEANFTSKK